jgi:hypothetical protein
MIEISMAQAAIAAAALLVAFFVLVLFGFVMGFMARRDKSVTTVTQSRAPEMSGPYNDPEGGYIEDEIWDGEDDSRVPTVRT